MRGLTVFGVPGRMTRRLAAIVLAGQGLSVFFGALVARALASSHGQPASRTFLVVGSVVAVLCILDAGLLRRPWGVTLGWLLQLATLASALIVPMMVVVGLLFGALWVTALVQGHRMDDLTARFAADPAGQDQAHGPTGSSPTATSPAASSPAASSPAASSPAASSPTARDAQHDG